MTTTNVRVRVLELVSSDELNELFRASWPDHTQRDFDSILRHSVGWITAHDERRLVGFVNIAWDGGSHAFLLDTTVHPDYRLQGIGKDLVETATMLAREQGAEWLHVDYEPHLERFYASCGFRHTAAGLIKL